MAVKDDGGSYPTESIISKSARKHYRIPVRSQHWQLRSLISAEKRAIVYFPGGHGSNQIQRLNVATNDCETIKLLTFAPRCLVAENGWLCCGSETGEFVAIRLDDDTASSTEGTTPAYDPNARLPSGMERPEDDSLLSLLSLPPPPRRTNKSLVAKSMKLAQDRVNCITLWFPPTFVSACNEAYNEPIAVLANNDRTVTLVSLVDFEHYEKTEPLDIITYPDFVNRATISPDGRLLIAILDDPYLYVHKRVAKKSGVGSWGGDDSEYHWEAAQRILLKSQRKDDKSDSRGSFAACFSASGAYLAIGTQHGTISIFDTALLTSQDADPLITTLQSSRPESSPGAVRDMEFCPGPYDILAWTEDRGHIGVADVRSNFRARQIIDINAEADFEHISILDRNTIDPRLLIRADRADGIAGSGRDASSRRDTQGVDSVNRPLTETETTVLDAIRGDRRRTRERERAAQTAQRVAALQRSADDIHRGASEASNAPTTSRTPPDEAEAQRSRNRDIDSILSRADPSRTDPSRTDPSRTDPGRTDPDGPSRAVADSRRAERDRATDRYRYYRAAIRETNNQQQSARRPTQQRLMDSINETVEAMRDQRDRDRQGSSYLSVLEILQGRDGGLGDDESSLLVPLFNQVAGQSGIRGTLAPDHGVFEVPPSPDNTAGLAWSDDGRTLFVGAQNGIYEFRVNIQARKFNPGITLR